MFKSIIITSIIFISAPRVQSQTSKILEAVTDDISEAKRTSFGNGGDPQTPCNNMSTINSTTRAGKGAFMHTVTKCGERSEFEMGVTKIGETYSYGWSYYIPESWVNSTESYDIIAQWACYPTKRNFKLGCGGVGSKMSIRGNTLRMDFQHKGDSLDIQCDKFQLGNIDDMKGKWVDFVMQVKWTGDKNGYLKLYMKVGNQPYVRKINFKGATFWNDEGSGPYFKMGLYKGDPNWKGEGDPRVLYTDEYRLGNAKAKFKDVSPGHVSR